MFSINEYNTIKEHVRTPVPTMDNRHIYIHLQLCIYNKQKGTDSLQSLCVSLPSCIPLRFAQSW